MYHNTWYIVYTITNGNGIQATQHLDVFVDAVLVLNGAYDVVCAPVFSACRPRRSTKKKIPWLLGKMFESRFLHASGREEG